MKEKQGEEEGGGTVFSFKNVNINK